MFLIQVGFKESAVSVFLVDQIDDLGGAEEFYVSSSMWKPLHILFGLPLLSILGQELWISYVRV